MVRPEIVKNVKVLPEHTWFKPAGVPRRALEEIQLTVSELEALRLADIEGRYHEDASSIMGVSRPTFGRIIASARNKVATALIEGKAIRIKGGKFKCRHKNRGLEDKACCQHDQSKEALP